MGHFGHCVQGDGGHVRTGGGTERDYEEFATRFAAIAGSIRDAVGRVAKPTLIQKWLTRVRKWRVASYGGATLDYFPGMPLFTLMFRRRLKYYLPDSTLHLERDQQTRERLEDYLEAYVVKIDDETIGRFTIRRKGTSGVAEMT